MSAIASFYILDTTKLDDLSKNAEIIVKKGFFSKKVTDNYHKNYGYHIPLFLRFARRLVNSQKLLKLLGMAKNTK